MGRALDWLLAIPRPALIGERLNPAGNPRLAARLARGDWDAVGEEARAQASAGARLLDVSGLFAREPAPLQERAALLAAVARARAACDLPLSIDSRDPALLAEGFRAAGGHALLNSLPATRATLDVPLREAARLGAPVVGLAMDEAGPSASAAERAAFAERFVRAGRALGMPAEHLIVDCLALPARGAPERARDVTLEAMRLVRARLGVPLVLGISNVSFGLAGSARRAAIAAFLAEALAAGLDFAIADPLDPLVRDALARAASHAPPRRSQDPRRQDPHRKEFGTCPS
jgi:5-methyltetrahydrofolate--homocysteine methyltransferase